jgi:hypothetical protein
MHAPPAQQLWSVKHSPVVWTQVQTPASPHCSEQQSRPFSARSQLEPFAAQQPAPASMSGASNPPCSQSAHVRPSQQSWFVWQRPPLSEQLPQPPSTQLSVEQ